MQCVNCQYAGSRVVDTNKDPVKNLITRRRECIKCGTRYSTQEHYRVTQHSNPPGHYNLKRVSGKAK